MVEVVVVVEGLALVFPGGLSAVLDPCFVVFAQIPRGRKSQSARDEMMGAQFLVFARRAIICVPGDAEFCSSCKASPSRLPKPQFRSGYFGACPSRAKVPVLGGAPPATLIQPL